MNLGKKWPCEMPKERSMWKHCVKPFPPQGFLLSLSSTTDQVKEKLLMVYPPGSCRHWSKLKQIEWPLNKKWVLQVDIIIHQTAWLRWNCLSDNTSDIELPSVLSVVFNTLSHPRLAADKNGFWLFWPWMQETVTWTIHCISVQLVFLFSSQLFVVLPLFCTVKIKRTY